MDFQALATPLQLSPAAALAALAVNDSTPASIPAVSTAPDAAAVALLGAISADALLGLVEHVLRTGSCPLPMHLQAAEVVSIIVEHPAVSDSKTFSFKIEVLFCGTEERLGRSSAADWCTWFHSRLRTSVTAQSIHALAWIGWTEATA